MKTVSIATLGCKTNQFESAALEESLRAAGYRLVPFEAGAELVVVNTCTVTAATDAQSRNLVRRAQRLNAGCRVVVTGCYAQVDPGALQSLPGVALVLGNEEKRDLLRHLAAGERVRVAEPRRAGPPSLPPALSSFAGRSRAFVQIQNGCDAFCSYCIIPYARGASRSVPPAEVLAQVRRLAAGYPETRPHRHPYRRLWRRPAAARRPAGAGAEYRAAGRHRPSAPGFPGADGDIPYPSSRQWPSHRSSVPISIYPCRLATMRCCGG